MIHAGFWSWIPVEGTSTFALQCRFRLPIIYEKGHLAARRRANGRPRRRVNKWRGWNKRGAELSTSSSGILRDDLSILRATSNAPVGTPSQCRGHFDEPDTIKREFACRRFAIRLRILGNSRMLIDESKFSTGELDVSRKYSWILIDRESCGTIRCPFDGSMITMPQIYPVG